MNDREAVAKWMHLNRPRYGCTNIPWDELEPEQADTYLLDADKLLAALTREQPEEREHVLFCDEYHQHQAPRCCSRECWCRKGEGEDEAFAIEKSADELRQHDLAMALLHKLVGGRSVKVVSKEPWFKEWAELAGHLNGGPLATHLTGPEAAKLLGTLPPTREQEPVAWVAAETLALINELKPGPVTCIMSRNQGTYETVALVLAPQEKGT